MPAAEQVTAAVVLCADRNIEVGEHVTLYSLLASARCAVRIHFINTGYSEADLARLRATLAPFADRYELLPRRADDAAFQSLPSTRGDRFTYLRLLLAELVDEPRVLYLDSGLVVGMDVGTICTMPLDGCALGACAPGTYRWSNDDRLCRELGLDVDAPYFNAGVLLLDLDAWRREALAKRCLDFAHEHATRLATADQTVLNLVFHRRFKALDDACNVPLFPASAPVPDACDRPCIFHFVGAPKPWDFLGRRLHRNHRVYADVVSRTQMRDYRFHRGLTWRRVARTLRNLRSYLARIRSPIR